MNNNEIYNKRQEAIKNASDVYNQIIQDQTNLISNQGKEIDSYLQNTSNNINQSINQNIGELNNASETARRQYEAEKQAIMNNYNNYTANNVDESVRIGALNSARNRINTSTGSLNDVVQEYNNQIAQAKITGQSMIAQNALEILKEKLNLYSTSMDNINNNLMSYRDNVANLVQQYGDLDAQYSGVRNDYLDRQEDFRQFNKEMAYNTQQLNTKKKLMEQQYQLDLQDAKEAYYDRLYSSSRSSSGGGYTISDSSGVISGSSSYVNTGNTAYVNGKNRKVYSKNGKYYYYSNGKYIQITTSNLSKTGNTKSSGGSKAYGSGSGGGGARGSSQKKSSSSNWLSKLFQILS